MKLTRTMIASFRFPGRMVIDDELEHLLLQRFGAEPYPDVYSEQDICEQVRKMVMHYNEEKGAVSRA